MYRDTVYNSIAIQKGGVIIAEKSRAEYFKQRRESRKSFSVLLPAEKVIAIEKWLGEHGKTKTAWVEEKIDEELSEKK